MRSNCNYNWMACVLIFIFVISCSQEWLSPSEAVPAGSIRLTGGSRIGEGRIEVFYNNEWGTVCDDSWGSEDAMVACRQLGFQTEGARTIHVFSHLFGEGVGTILLDDVACTGSEAALSECQHRGWESHNCGHHEDAGVSCCDSNECPSSPCVNGGLYIYGINQYVCHCNAGWIGTNCEIDNNECASAPCINGQCQDGINQYECLCDIGWIGTNCEINIPIINHKFTNITVKTDPCFPTAIVSWNYTITVIDHSGNVTLTSNYEPGDSFPIGVTDVVYTATNPSGNSVNVTFSVTVRATTTEMKVVVFESFGNQEPLEDADVKLLEIQGPGVTERYAAAKTNSKGVATLKVPSDPQLFVLTASKQNYLETAKRYDSRPNEENVVVLFLSEFTEINDFTYTGTARNFEFGGAEGANNFRLGVPTGALNVRRREKIAVRLLDIDVSDPANLATVPELVGLKEEGDELKEVQLEVFVVAELTMFSHKNGEPPDLNSPVIIEFPMDNYKDRFVAGEQIEAWYFDTDRGYWIQDGFGTLQQTDVGFVWTYEASHFTWWSAAEAIEDFQCVTAKACFDPSCNKPALGIRFQLTGLGYNFYSAQTTSSSGEVSFKFKYNTIAKVSQDCTGDHRTVSNGQKITSLGDTGPCQEQVYIVPGHLNSKCPVQGTPENGARQGDAFTYGNAVSYFCDPEYTIHGSSSRVCLECSKWSGYRPYCELADYSSSFFIPRRNGEGSGDGGRGDAGSGSILLDDVKCTGSESSLSQCEHRGWGTHDCSHGDDAGVSCASSIRLAGGSRIGEGRVEVFYNNEWGTVCDHGWHTQDAMVVCRQLGFSTGSSFEGTGSYPPSIYYARYFGPGVGPILLDGVDCTGSEDALSECQHDGWGIHDCDHYEDAGVSCDINECDDIPCINGQCQDGINQGECQCDFGWIGTNCEIDIPIINHNLTNIMVNTDPGSPAAVVTWDDTITVTDQFGNITLTSNFESGDSFPIGDNDVVYIATNPSGKSVNVTFSVTVEDNEPPTFSHPFYNISFSTQPGLPYANVTWDRVTATDNSGQPTVTSTFRSGEGFPIGISNVEYNATDAYGNVATEYFIVTVKYIEAPRLNCPIVDEKFAVTGNLSLNVTWEEPSYKDNSGKESGRNSTHLPGSSFPIGNDTVIYTAWDPSGNMAECTIKIVVTAACPAISTTEESQTISWSLSAAENQPVHSNERCDVNTEKRGHGIAVRNCVQHEELGAKWLKTDLVYCGEKDEPDLQDLTKTAVVESNVENVAEALNSVTQDLKSFTSNNIEDVATTFKTIVSVGSGTPEVAVAVVGIVDNIVGAAIKQTNNVEESEKKDSNLIDILKAFEEQVNISTSQGKELSVVKTNLILKTMVIQPNQTNEPVTFVVRSSGDGKGDFGEGDLLQLEGETRSSVSLPSTLFNSINNETIGVSIVVHNSDTLFPNNETNTTVSGDIISIVTGVTNVNNLTDPVALNFTVAGENPTCVFWDFDILDWSRKGCELAESIGNQVMCHCNHLTNFAVLVDVTYSKSHIVLDVVSKVGCGLSMCSLLVTLIVFLYFRKLRSGKNATSRKILIQFCTALLLLYFVFLVGIDRVSHRGGCIFVSALLHFLTLASLSWMGVEAHHMYLNVVKVFDAIPEHFLLKASLVAWGFPLLVSLISLGAGIRYYDHMQYCFVAGPPLHFGLILPIAIILLHNTIAFILVMRRLLKANLGGTVHQQSKAEQISQRLQNAFAISVLMGLTWVFGFFAIDGAKFAFSLIFCLFNSFQGVVVFGLFCVRQEDVQKTLRQFIRSILHLPERTARATSMTASTGVMSTSSGPKNEDVGISLTNMPSPSSSDNPTYDFLKASGPKNEDVAGISLTNMPSTDNPTYDCSISVCNENRDEHCKEARPEESIDVSKPDDAMDGVNSSIGQQEYQSSKNNEEIAYESVSSSP